MVRIAEIEDGSIADELNLEIGTRIVRINGEPVRDGIDLTFLLADTELDLETVSPDGEVVLYEIEREPGTPMGIVPAPDTIRECANKCVFCFIDGNPKDARPTLWLRDDDFRLSFTYGSYVTLTNLGPKGLQRLIDQRISPLYVSVHATEPEVRERLLVNKRAGLILSQLWDLISGGLEVHTQVVLCPVALGPPHSLALRRAGRPHAIQHQSTRAATYAVRSRRGDRPGRPRARARFRQARPRVVLRG